MLKITYLWFIVNYSLNDEPSLKSALNTLKKTQIHFCLFLITRTGMGVAQALVVATKKQGVCLIPILSSTNLKFGQKMETLKKWG